MNDNLDINAADFELGLLNSGVRDHDLQKKVINILKDDLYADGVLSATWEEIWDWADDEGMLDEVAYMLKMKEQHWASHMAAISAPSDPIDGP